jgi:hypothetical protein
MKKGFSLFLVVIYIFALAACSSTAVGSTGISYASQSISEVGSDVTTTADTQASSAATPIPVEVDYDDEDLEMVHSASVTASIALQGDTATVQGGGAVVNGSVVTINQPGVYLLSGSLEDGQIVVNSDNEEMVSLLLDGVDITCSTSAPIYVIAAEKVIITLAEGSQNSVTDGDAYEYPDAETDEPDAAIFSHDDLTINGTGALTVNANYNNGIVSKDDLIITGGTITVIAVNDGIKGRDSIAILDGTLTVKAGGDGLQANNDEEAEQGYISIDGGTLDITAGADGIQAVTRLLVNGGNLTITSGSGWMNSYNSSTDSAKGLKAGSDLTISGGILQITSTDDALHSNGTLTIEGGEFLLASADDGIHADTSLVINDGSLTITESYEGIESAAITINGGTIHLAASDDGINAAGGVNEASGFGGRGQDNFDLSGNYSLNINGGYVYVDAIGDGLDINGTIDMNGGTVIVNGPTSNGNGPVDYLGSFTIDGGFFVAVGSAGMAQAPSETSTQYSVMQYFSSALSGGTLFHLVSEAGEEILTFQPTKAYQSVLVSSPELVNGETYLVYTGGSSTGTPIDGLYAEGFYTPGNQVASFTISSMVTGGGMGGGFPGGGPGGGMRPGRP